MGIIVLAKFKLGMWLVGVLLREATCCGFIGRVVLTERDQFTVLFILL